MDGEFTKKLIKVSSWWIRLAIWFLLLFVLGMTTVVLPELLDFHEPLSFLVLNATILSIIAGIAAIVFGLFRRFHPRFMKIWAIISLILGTYISFSFFVGKIRDFIGLLLFFTAETVAIFGAGVVISILSDLFISQSSRLKPACQQPME
jgi:hypothetical protein